MVLGPRASASLFLPMRGQASFYADTPGHISSWERLARIRWKAAVREGSVYEREAHVVQVRRHIAQVDGFLKATRASLADSGSSRQLAEQPDAGTPYVWVHGQ